MVYAVLVVVAGLVANLLFAGMFLARIVAPRHASALGLAGTAMAVPLGAAAGIAMASGLGAWAAALPLVFVAFAVVEVLVDVVGIVDVRHSRWLWPYLLAFYAAQWAVIGAAFLADERGGFVVLASYFVTLGATAVSYRRVGHGAPVPTDADGAAPARRSVGGASRRRHRPG